jgi:hypothetical protein
MKTVLRLYQHQDWSNLTWAQALEKFPTCLIEVREDGIPSWGSVWFVQGQSGELSYFKENFDSSD